jgi:hypothetical protein
MFRALYAICHNNLIFYIRISCYGKTAFVQPKTFYFMPAENEVYPIESVVRIKKTGQFAIIKQQTFLMGRNNFLHYLGVIEGRGEGWYYLGHHDIELEALPNTHSGE